MATNIFSLAKEIRNKHPRMSVQASVQKAGKQLRAEKKSAVGSTKKRKTVAKAKTAAPKRKTSRVAAVKVGAVKRSATMGAYERGKKIHGVIDGLEAKYAKENRKELKELLRLAINAEHDKLDNLKKAYKKVS